jgi:hypothetical protein
VGELTSNGKATVLHCNVNVEYRGQIQPADATQITYKPQVFVGILSSDNAAADWSMFVHCVKRFQPEIWTSEGQGREKRTGMVPATATA